MKKIVYLLLLLWCLCSCSDELLDGPARPVLAADSVRVTLGFNSLSFESPFSAGPRTFAVSPDGVEAELVEMPVPLDPVPGKKTGFTVSGCCSSMARRPLRS